MRAYVLFAVALAALSGACTKDRLKESGCRTDRDCGDPASAYRCDVPSGLCYCRTNDACRPREFCNVAGFCQDRAGCEKNTDCGDPALYCDTSNGTCLSRGRCTGDLQCKLGEVCDRKKSLCVEGCYSGADCSAGACRCGDVPCACDGGIDCALGECDVNFCASPNDCRFGEQCGAEPDAGQVRNACYSDYDDKYRPYCAACTFGGGLSICGSGPNYCLIDTQNPGNYYCGSDCSDGQRCPRGYGCQDVVVVFTQWACTKANPACPTNPSLPCASDSDCKRGGTCAKQAGAATGLCAGKCSIAEGDPGGFCTCQVDEDCATETCTAGECSISRRKCVSDSDCRSIRCVDYAGAGGCFIGQNCAPDNGLSCIQVQSK